MNTKIRDKEIIINQLRVFFLSYPEINSFQCWFPSRESLSGIISKKTKVICKINDLVIGNSGIAALHLFKEKLEAQQADYQGFLIEINITAERLIQIVERLLVIDLVEYQGESIFTFKKEDFL